MQPRAWGRERSCAVRRLPLRVLLPGCQAFARFLDRLDGPYTSASRPNQFLFCSTLADNRRTIILVIEPLSQSDRASSNSCFSD